MDCEDDAKCCRCFPIGCGIKVFAVLSILACVNNFVNLIEVMSVSPGYAACLGVGGFFFVIQSIFYLKYLLADNQDNRDWLPIAVLCAFIGNLVNTCAILILNSANTAALDAKYEIDAEKGYVGVIIGSLILNIIISGYFYKVMIKYAA